MEKLTIKELAPYLPYDVLINTIYDKPQLLVCDSYLCNQKEDSISLMTVINNQNELFLYPLSHITKPIIFEGKEIVLIHEIGGYYKEFPDELILDVQSKECSQRICLLLIKYRFDVNNLIDRNIAIDVTKLETNPYEVCI